MYRNTAIAASFLSCAMLAQTSAFGQGSNPPAQQPAVPAPSAASTSPSGAQQPAEQLLKAEELEALVAPIALYPDNLLSLVLMASTYPLEVVQADRFLKENAKLKPDELKAAVDKQSWDDSVKSLVAAPEAVTMMNTKLDWTVKLGNAVLAQQPDVMDAVQRLRTKADANNKLTSTKEQKVSKRQEGSKQVIVIEPTEPQTIYVPYYDPAVVYGAWPYEAYPPYYFGWPGYIPGGLIATGIAFGAGFALGRWTSGGNYWGGGFNWNNNNINVNRPVNINTGGNNWQHNPEHRHGIKYDNPRVQQRYGNNNLQAGRQDRMDFRGRDGNQVLKPDGGRPGAGGDRPGAGQLPTKGAGAGQRPNAGQLPSSKGAGAGAGKGASAGKGAGAGKGASAKQTPSKGGGSAAKRPSGGQRPSAAPRPSGGGANAMANIGGGARASNLAGARGHASIGGGGFSGGPRGGGAGFSGGGGRGGGGFAGGGGGRGGGGGGGRRSDIALKHDVVLIDRLANGLAYYSFRYRGEQGAYVGVMAQEVQAIAPDAVVRDQEGHLRVLYDKLGIRFQTYDEWLASGGRIPLVTK